MRVQLNFCGILYSCLPTYINHFSIKILSLSDYLSKNHFLHFGKNIGSAKYVAFSQKDKKFLITLFLLAKLLKIEGIDGFPPFDQIKSVADATVTIFGTLFSSLWNGP